MRKRYIVLPVLVVLGSGTAGLLQMNRSPQVQGLIAETRINSPARSAEKRIESSHERIYVHPNEQLSLDVTLHPGPGRIRLEAPNGGVFPGRRGSAEVDPPAKGQPLRVQFTPGRTRGRYTVELSRGDSTNTLEFWVGAESPQGEPGPQRTFNPQL